MKTRDMAYMIISSYLRRRVPQFVSHKYPNSRIIKTIMRGCMNFRSGSGTEPTDRQWRLMFRYHETTSYILNRYRI